MTSIVGFFDTPIFTTMTKKGGRKSQSQDELAIKLFTETQSESEPSPLKKSTKKTPKSFKNQSAVKDRDSENVDEQAEGLVQEIKVKISEEIVSKARTPSAKKMPKSVKKTPKRKTPSQRVDDDDDEVTFNFDAKSAKESANPQLTDVADPETVIKPETVVKTTRQSAKKLKKSAKEDQTDCDVSQPDDVVIPTTPIPAEELEDLAMEAEKTAAEGPKLTRNMVNRPSAIKKNSKKKKSSGWKEKTPPEKTSKKGKQGH